MHGGLKPRAAPVNRQNWGASARDWSAIQAGQFAPGYMAVPDHCGVAQGTDHLDAGCGSGMAVPMAAARQATVSGLDPAEALLAIARARRSAAHFVQGELADLPWSDHSFDVATGLDSFQFAGNPVVAVAVAAPVAAPVAVAVAVAVAVPVARGPGAARHQDRRACRHHDLGATLPTLRRPASSARRGPVCPPRRPAHLATLRRRTKPGCAVLLWMRG